MTTLSILLSTRLMMVYFLQETQKLFSHLRGLVRDKELRVGKSHRPQISQAANLKLLQSSAPNFNEKY